MSNNRARHKKRKEGTPYTPPFDADVLAQSVSVLSPSVDLAAKLQKGNVNTLLDVVTRTERDFFRIPTFNKKNWLELSRLLGAKGLYARPAEPPEVREAPEKGGERGANAQAKPAAEKEERARNANGQRGAKERRGAPRDPAAPNNRQPRGNDGGKGRPEKQRAGRIWEPDGVSEQATKAERERHRPRRQVLQAPPDPYVKINRNGKWGFQDRRGKEVVAPVYDEVFSYKEDLCCVEKDGAFGFIDRNGEEVIPAVYECAASFSEGLACVFKGGVCGYINKQNEVVVDFHFDAGTAVQGGNCRVKREGKWGELWIDRPSEIRWIN